MRGAALLVVAVGVMAVWADEPTKLTPTERETLEKEARELNTEGMAQYRKGDVTGTARRFREALAIRQRLYPELEYPHGHPELAQSLNNLAFVLQTQGRSADAELLYREALAMRRRLYPASDHPRGHPDLARSLNNLAFVLEAQGQAAAAEPLYREALTVRRWLYPDKDYPRGHPDLATSLNNLAAVLDAQGRAAVAEPLYRETLAMRRRLYPDTEYPQGHPELAQSLNNLAYLLRSQGKLPDAESLYRDALAMYRRLYPDKDYPHGHSALALSLNNLAAVLQAQGKSPDAESLYRDALAMYRRLYPDKDYPHGHPALALSLNNLAFVVDSQGKTAEAEPLYREALAMYRRLYSATDYPAGHPDLTLGLNNLAAVLQAQGKATDAEPLYREVLAMSAALADRYASSRSEADALAFARSFPLTRDGFLSLPLAGPDAADRAYAGVWASRSVVTRAAERKHLAARAVADPAAKKLWADQSAARRRLADLTLAPAPALPAARQARDKEMADLSDKLLRLDAALAAALPAATDDAKLAQSTPADLYKVLPTDAAFVDLLRYTRFAHNLAKPGKAGETRTPSYVAFVVSRSAVARIDLGPADPIEATVRDWRERIISGRPDGDAPATLRKLVWAPLSARLPAGVATVYLAPDRALTAVPWAALPGAKPDSILLDDHPVLTVPHGRYLLGSLMAAPLKPDPARGLLAVGGVDYDAASADSPLGELAAPAGQAAKWAGLGGAADEAGQVAELAYFNDVPLVAAPTPLPRRFKPEQGGVLSGKMATAAAVLTALPKARVAHLATHGFFADPSFRSAFQLDPKLFERGGVSDRPPPAGLSPFVLSGLVFAGANDTSTPGRGIVTGDAILGLDLSGLDLAILSACETGLGDVAGGEGVFGLQTAFHLAGTRNVVASLWKVDDAVTAKLMRRFYVNLWDKKLTPAEALREAQRFVYRNPKAVGLDGETTPTGKWAAFVMSGVGR